MISFRVEEDEAASVERWAKQLGVGKSELLREAVHRHLTRLASERDAATWARLPLTDDETGLAAIADWGAAEEWTDWADALR
jgi:hypothetical protein